MMLAMMLAQAAASGSWEDFKEVPDNAWVQFASAPTGALWEVRSKDIHPTKSEYVSVWIRINAGADKTVRWRRSMTLYSVDCRSRSFQSLSAVLYGADGRVLNSWNTPYRIGANEVAVPDSMGESMVDTVCPEK